METLLLTGTIKPNNNNKKHSIVLYNNNYFDPEYRYKQYFKTISFYITQSKFNNIIFCENSNYPIKDIKHINQLCKGMGKQFELLQFKGNSKAIQEYGYGYGEAEIFDYAFEHSQLLKKNATWFKITGRYIIKNINTIIESYKNDSLYLNKGRGYSLFSVTTAFFKMNNNFYNKYLYKKSLKNYTNIINQNKLTIKSFSLERSWYHLLRKILLKNKLTKTKTIPNYVFLSTYKKIFQYIKKYLGMYDFGIIGKIIDKILFIKSCESLGIINQKTGKQ